MEKIREEKVEVNMDNMEDVFDAMLDAQCEELKKENHTGQEQVQAGGVLEKFKNFIQSRRFDESCKAKAKQAGVKDYKIIKNAYVAGILGKIADTLNLVVRITADVIMYAVEFLTRLAGVVVNFASGLCNKIISLFTLNCGTAVA